jgi:hypothetical protein
VVSIDMKTFTRILFWFLLFIFFWIGLLSLVHIQETYKDMTTRLASVKQGDSVSEKEDRKFHYSSDNYNVEYHDSISDIATQTGMYDSDSGIAWAIDPSGKKIALPKLKGHDFITYYNPGTYKYGASNYVPTYEDSIYLSKMYRRST